MYCRARSFRTEAGAGTDFSAAFEAPLALATYGQNEADVEVCDKAVKCDVPARSVPDDQFAFATFHRPADQRAESQDLQGLNDLLDPPWSIGSLELGHMIKEPIKVVKDLRRKLKPNSSITHQTSLRAAGLLGRSPFKRASRYALASSQGTVFPVESTWAQRASATR